MTQAAEVPYGSDREYETIYVLRPDADRENTERVATRVSDVIAKGGGKLTRVENWGRRRLAYDVKKYKRGVYVYLTYVGRGELVSEIERNLRMLDAVLKFQTVKIRDGLVLDSVAVAEEAVKFEHIEAPPDEEPEETLAQTLGLEEPRRDESAEAGEGQEAAEGGGEPARAAAGEGDGTKASDDDSDDSAKRGDASEEEE